jgi:hypothetical protein
MTSVMFHDTPEGRFCVHLNGAPDGIVVDEPYEEQQCRTCLGKGFHQASLSEITRLKGQPQPYPCIACNGHGVVFRYTVPRVNLVPVRLDDGG